MTKKIILLAAAALFSFTYSCKKKNDNINDTSATQIEFLSLSANPVKIDPGETSTLTAVANGENLTYQWTMTHGDLFGSGATVIYGAQPCCAGTNVITCKVSDGRTSITKTVEVEVRPGK